jgi:hypothetical protein
MNPDSIELLTSISLTLTGKGASCPSFELQLAKRGQRLQSPSPCANALTLWRIHSRLILSMRLTPNLFFRRASTPIRISHSIHTVHNHNPTTDQSKQWNENVRSPCPATNASFKMSLSAPFHIFSSNTFHIANRQDWFLTNVAGCKYSLGLSFPFLPLLLPSLLPHHLFTLLLVDGLPLLPTTTRSCKTSG